MRSNIKIIETTKESEIKDVPIPKSKEEELLYKYFPDQFKKQVVDPKKQEIGFTQKKAHPRKDSDNLYQKTNQDYYDVKYPSTDVNGFSPKIEIRSDMKF